MTTTSVYPYTFDSISRIGNDDTSINQRNQLNMHHANYSLENFYPQCPMTQAKKFALNQPNVFYNGSHEGGIKGCEMESSNNLKYTHITKPACKLSLTTRPFLTVPYLGRGAGDPEMELKIKTGQNFLNKKTNNAIMEECFSEYQNYPLIDPIKKTVNNSSYLIESDAMKGWKRGGISARDIARNQENNN